MSILTNKIVLLVVAGIVIAGVVWYSFMRAPSTSLLQTQDVGTNPVDGDVVTILLQLRSVSLSGTIFSDPAFMSLQDFGSEIMPEPVGRANPFAPLGSIRTGTTTPAPAQPQGR